LIDEGISDLQPLTSFTKLKWLFLRYNQIEDLQPLTSLIELEILDLGGNQVSNLKPLAKLKNWQKITSAISSHSRE
jgi:internalin A